MPITTTLLASAARREAWSRIVRAPSRMAYCRFHCQAPLRVAPALAPTRLLRIPAASSIHVTKRALATGIAGTEALQETSREAPFGDLYRDLKRALRTQNPQRVWDTVLPLIETRQIQQVPILFIEETFWLLSGSRGRPLEHANVTTTDTAETSDGTAKPLGDASPAESTIEAFDQFLDAIYAAHINLPSWSMYATWLRRERARGHTERVYLLYRIASSQLNEMTSARALALEEVIIMAAAQRLERTSSPTPQHDVRFTKHPARYRATLEMMVTDAFSPAIRLTNQAWSPLLKWLAFRWPVRAWQLYEKARQDGYQASADQVNTMFIGATVMRPDHLSLMLTYYNEIRRLDGTPDRRPVSVMIHALLAQQHKDATKAEGRRNRKDMFGYKFTRRFGDRPHNVRVSKEAELENLWDTLPPLKKSPSQLLDTAMRVFYEQLEDGDRVQPGSGRLLHAPCVRMLLMRLDDSGRMEQAEEIYALCREHGKDGRQPLAYSSMIRAYIRRGNLDQAHRVLMELLEDTLRVHPDGTVTGPGGEPTAPLLQRGQCELFNELFHDDEHGTRRTNAGAGAPSSPSHTATSQLPVKRFTSRDELVVCTVWAHAQAACSLMDAYGRHGRFDDAEKVYQLLTKKYKIWHESLVAPMMRVLLKMNRPERACEVEKEALRAGVPPFETAFVVARVRAHVACGNMDEAERIVHDYTPTLHHGRDPVDARQRPSHVYNALASGYAAQGKLDVVRNIYDDMRLCGVALPAPGSWTAHHEAAAAQGSMDELFEVTNELERDGYRLGPYNYSTIISFLGERRELSLAKDQFRKAVDDQVLVNASLVTAMMRAYSLSGEGRAGYKFFVRMRAQHRFYIDHAMLSVLLDMAGHHLDVQTTAQLWKEACDMDGLQPNANNYASLAEAYGRQGALDRAVQVLTREMPHAGMRPATVLFPGLKHWCNGQGRQDLVHQLQRCENTLAKSNRAKAEVDQPQ
ncbi:hypothetical protein THASP1DRAFT_28586 [Thamnocephalis sphaerospora]|uniref:Pentacotripeptide-repeat region of PRORP domain-containing protein n=1 Tax=Thamnocephalis sphaerospora TaxID=78915 RepID=A0A4P9XW23_9FUNG|nr:hypothetical protein THASP1DRAFT_28586 [Thamnocephalis sphaerospora]|eukprot:RKP09610.1 hypothetical protein THASP1DRAFT_28586 [Thamnocephalis sphaerospora]